MEENKYSIKDLEEMVQNGTMTKKVVKSTYAREFLSRALYCLSASSIIGGVTAGIGGTFAFCDYYDRPGKYENFSDALLPFIAGGFASGFLAFGWMTTLQPFYKWRERAKPYVEAGGKVIYLDRKTKNEFILPLNYPTDKNEKLDFHKPFTGYIDPVSMGAP